MVGGSHSIEFGFLKEVKVGRMGGKGMRVGCWREGGWGVRGGWE